MGIDVTGGAGGIQAFLDDLVSFAHLLSTAATTVAAAEHQAAFGRLEIGGCSGLDLGAHNHQLDELLAALSGPAHHAISELNSVSFLLKLAASSYQDTDDGLFHVFTSALGALPVALAKGAGSLVMSGDPLATAQQVATADPELTSLLVDGSALGPAARLSATACDDGHPVVTDASNDVSVPAVTPPRGLGDLITELSERNDGVSGEISVSFVYTSDGRRRAIVDIPGTKSWSPAHTADITSLATNMRAIEGLPTSYETGVLEAMTQAGVTSTDDVMLVGHSEGGMVAVNAARDATRSGQFHVTHVLTAGAPIGHTVGALPPSVQVLALEGRGDVVPRLDGADNPDLPNVTTVRGGHDHGSIGGNHSVDDSYVPLAADADHSGNTSVRHYLDTAAGFLGDERMTTERYVITRGY